MDRVLIVEVPVTLCVPFVFRSVIYTWVVYKLWKSLLLCACALSEFNWRWENGELPLSATRGDNISDGVSRVLDYWNGWIFYVWPLFSRLVSLPCWRGCEFSFLWFWILKLIFPGCSWGFGIFQACSVRCFLIIGGAEHVAHFSCWCESVIERGSLIEILEKE